MTKKINFNIIKNIRYFVFYLFYGKIKKTIKAKNNKKISIKKIKFNNSIFYNFYNIKNGRLFTNTVDDTAYIIEKYLIDEPSFQYRFRNNKIVNAKISDNFVISNGTPRFIKKINGTVFSLLTGGAGKNNYWHWIFDVLPRIGILEKSKLNKPPDYYLIPSKIKDYQIQSLSILGIPNKKLIDGAKQKHIKSNQLIAVDHPTVFNNNPSKGVINIPHWIILWLRKKYLKKKKNNSKFPKKFYIDRSKDSNTNSRNIVNNDEVKKHLQKYGFKSITLSQYNFIDQVKLFNNAKIIVGLHGAGFANMVFSKPKTKIIEIKTLNNGSAILNLAKKCKLDYNNIIEKNINNSLMYQNSHIKVSLIKLDKIIKSF